MGMITPDTARCNTESKVTLVLCTFIDFLTLLHAFLHDITKVQFPFLWTDLNKINHLDLGERQKSKQLYVLCTFIDFV